MSLTPPGPAPYCLSPGEPFPPAHLACGPDSGYPGLLAVGGALDVPTLLRAYRGGIFPWFSQGQPLLWWSTDPRMVLRPGDFRLHRSLRRSLRDGLASGELEVVMDRNFEAVIHACSQTPRAGQSGTWIVRPMVSAYLALHRAGHAHSVETYWQGRLVGGLYLVNIGRMVFGESMFSHRSDASKLALAALVAFARVQHLDLIDCQQDTPHLRSLGARDIPRQAFLDAVNRLAEQAAPHWRFDSVYWNELLPDTRFAP